MSAPTSSLAIELRSPDSRRRIAAMVRLSAEEHTSLDADALEALIENLASESKTVARHAASAIATLSHSNPLIVSRLVDLLGAANASTRWTAAYALGLIDGALDLRAGPAVIEALANNDGDVRWAALDLIVRLGRLFPEAIRASLLALQPGDDANRHKMSLYALRNLGLSDSDVLAAIRDASASPDRHVRFAALAFIRESAGTMPGCVDIVLRCLDADPDEGVRRAAAGILGYLQDRSEPVLARLREAAAAPHDPSLRKAARQTLARLKEEP
jgi:HEAT repeat protein